MDTAVAGSGGIARTVPVASAIILVPVLGVTAAFAAWGNNSGRSTLADNLAEPLNGATSAKVDINVGTGNLTIDRLTGGEPLLVGGTLQYFENQGLPTRAMTSFNGETTLALKASGPGKAMFRLPWATLNGAFEWLIHLNPTVKTELTAHSDGGNVRLDLAGTAVTRLTADTSGGSMEVVLPEIAGEMNVSAKSGGGNVKVTMPSGMAARIHAATGWGKVIVDPRFSKVDANIYQSPDYDGAANRVELTAGSGAGNVTVTTK